ncbi:MAG: chloride channel protein, partial [Gammaproteobacteria bacterium]
MAWIPSVRRRFTPLLDEFRVNLSRPDAMLQLALLGILSGLLAGGIIVVFRLGVEGVQSHFLPGGSSENFEDLPVAVRFLLPIAGALVIAACFAVLGKGQKVVGLLHVMERLAYHQGYLSLRGLVLQFVGAGVAIASGHSVGREGPSVHLGAASSSQLGQYLALPNNSIRTLVGCGTAAAIAAAFNTPLAGVIFALEVVMMEYTLASFTPVILAAVSATAVSRLVYGSAMAFDVPALSFVSLSELPYVFILGVACGIAASIFVVLVRVSAQRSSGLPFWLRLCLAGVVVGACAIPYPQVMGIGYDTVTGALLGQLAFGVLIGVAIAKLIATAACVGLGVPAGLIGPTLVAGACLGGVAGLLARYVHPDQLSHIGLYALLGMGAMMGAVLQAPLAALVAVFELTGNPNIILPGMLAIVTAGLTSRELFGNRSVFLALLKLRDLDYRNDPVMQALRRIGVANVMERDVKRHDRMLSRTEAEDLVAAEPTWILIDVDSEPKALMPAVDLVRALQENEEETLDL